MFKLTWKKYHLLKLKTVWTQRKSIYIAKMAKSKGKSTLYGIKLTNLHSDSFNF